MAVHGFDSEGIRRVGVSHEARCLGQVAGHLPLHAALRWASSCCLALSCAEDAARAAA
jgi:hypothetical protein